MTTRFSVHTKRKLRGIHVHTVSREVGAASERVEWLLDLHRETERAEQARIERERRLASVLDACEEAIATIPDTVAAKLGEVASIASELGLSLARAIVGSVIDQGLGDTPGTVLRCLEEAVPCVDVRVCLSPEDHASVTASFAEFPELADRFSSASFVADPTLQHGCVRVDSDFGRTSYDPRIVIEDICAEVRKELEE